MKNEIFIDEFGYEMEDILLEKLSKYKDTWKTVSINTLISDMNEQIKKLPTIFLDKKKTRRTLLHIANYCFFLYNRLGE